MNNQEEVLKQLIKVVEEITRLEYKKSFLLSQFTNGNNNPLPLAVEENVQTNSKRKSWSTYARKKKSIAMKEKRSSYSPEERIRRLQKIHERKLHGHA